MLYTKRVTLVFLFQFVCTLAFVVYCLLIVINFAEMFHKNLTLLHRKRENDSWLQARCKEQEFVHHIRHHIDLCETVERDALTNAYLSAMQMALDGLHLCGSYSCEKILIRLTESLRLSIYTWIASLVIVMVMLPLCVLPLYRKWQRNLLLHENHLGHNARVPTIYIRDQIDHMHDVPFQNIHNTHTLSSGESSSSQSSHFSTQPRHRRLLCNSNESGSTTKDAQHVDTILHIPTPPPYTTNHYGMMQSRYPNYHDHDT
jgi:hypothetical protein